MELPDGPHCESSVFGSQWGAEGSEMESSSCDRANADGPRNQRPVVARLL